MRMADQEAEWAEGEKDKVGRIQRWIKLVGG